MFFMINYRPWHKLIVSWIVESKGQIVDGHFISYYIQQNQEAVNWQQPIYLYMVLVWLAEHDCIIADRVNFLNYEVPRMTLTQFFENFVAGEKRVKQICDLRR